MCDLKKLGIERCCVKDELLKMKITSTKNKLWRL